MNARDFNSQTPLHAACRREVLRSVVDTLLTAGADVDLMDKSGQTTIEIAVDMYNNNSDTLIVLIIPILQHELRLEMAGCPISEEIALPLLIRNSIRLMSCVGRDFERCCSEELQRDVLRICEC